MPDPWIKLDSRPVYQCRILRLTEDRLRMPSNGKTHTFVRIEVPDWVNVIALTSDRKVVCVEQYRHGTGKCTLEIPGGQVDPGEMPMEAARRELLEETGYTSDDWTELGRVHPNPAVQGNSCVSFLAGNVRRTHEPRPDDAEDLAVHLHPLREIPRLLQDGHITHALVHGAFFWLSQRNPELWEG